MENGETKIHKPPLRTRRKLLSSVLAGVGLGAIVESVRRLNNDPTPTSAESIPKSSSPPELSLTTPRIEQQKKEHELLKRLEVIHHTPLEENGRPNPKRLTVEQDYVLKAESIDELTKGFWVLTDMNTRSALLNKRHEYRKQGKGELTMPPQEYVEWADANDIHPEVISLCLESYEDARRVIDKLKPRLQANTTPQTSPDALMMSLGGMAKLIQNETMNFATIGTGVAWDEINPKFFPTAQKDLADLTTALSFDTGISFKSHNIPGSVPARGSNIPDVSGGAIGLQFMPNQAWDLYKLMRDVGEKFNPFDLKSSLIGGWVFLARELRDNDGDIVRYGFRQGDKKAEEKAIEKWNPHKIEVASIYNAHKSFLSRFHPQAKAR